MYTKRNKFFIFLFVLFSVLFYVQLLFSPFKLLGLGGAFESAKKADFTVDNFLNGHYQDSAERYLKEQTPFRGDLVRLRNQLDYSLFDKLHSILQVGKDNYLFDPGYINARAGSDLLSDTAFARDATELKNCKHLLDSLKIPLIFCIAPNKANYYAEKLIPYVEEADITNKTKFVKLLLSMGIKVIDFDSYFLTLKKKPLPCVLVPPHGAHWSIYGASFAADSLYSTLKAVVSKPLAGYKLIDYEISDNARFSDDDYSELLNCMTHFKSVPFYYPRYAFINGKQPNCLVVGDSFFWSFYDLGLYGTLFHPSSQFWYYNNTIYNTNREKIADRDGKVVMSDIRNRDAIIIMTASASLPTFSFNFFKQLNNQILNSKKNGI